MYICIPATCIKVCTDPRRGCQILWTWNWMQLWATCSQFGHWKLMEEQQVLLAAELSPRAHKFCLSLCLMNRGFLQTLSLDQGWTQTWLFHTCLCAKIYRHVPPSCLAVSFWDGLESVILLPSPREAGMTVLDYHSGSVENFTQTWRQLTSSTCRLGLSTALRLDLRWQVQLPGQCLPSPFRFFDFFSKLNNILCVWCGSTR